MVKNGFYDVYCCGQYLASVPANTSCKCPDCNKWQHKAGSQGEKLKEEGKKQNATNCV